MSNVFGWQGGSIPLSLTKGTVTAQHSDRKPQSPDGKAARILFSCGRLYSQKRMWGSYPHRVAFSLQFPDSMINQLTNSRG